jgi:formate--tetrahydrofolate ligase
VVTEAGFGADLGAEKFFDIKCRKAGLDPAATVIVATVRALKMHGGVGKADLGAENVAAVETGCTNLKRHVDNVKGFGVPVVVAVNRFLSDTDAEIEAVRRAAEAEGATAIECTHWADGGAGAEELARHVVELVDSGAADFKPLYQDALPLWDKVERIATQIYGASGISADDRIKKQFEELQGPYGHFPVCMAKTQYSLSTDPNLKGAPEGHVVPIREVRVSGGAEFLVVVTGAIMTMPGLPRVPAANSIHLNDEGQVEGLF